MSDLQLRFSGPFGWLPGGSVPNVRAAGVGGKAGLYLWTAETPDGHLVYYVGETGRSFASRMEEHLVEQLAGKYRFYEPAAFLRGQKRLVWRGVYGRRAEPGVAAFAEQLPAFAPLLAQFIGNMRFLLAPTDCDDRARKRIEAALADWFMAQGEPVGSFQDQGVHYDRRRPEEPRIEVSLSWEVRPVGAPERLEA